MLGAVIGDIVGSIYEFSNIKTKDFEFFDQGMSYTDDSILSIATADWLLHGGHVAHYYGRYASAYPCPVGGYGGMFFQWARKVAQTGQYEPYNSCGNGSAMRIGPVGWFSDDKATVLQKAEESASCTHNHPEGIKGAKATALALLMARQGETAEAIGHTVESTFGYDLSMSVEELQARYSWHGIDGEGHGGTCQDSVPQAIRCALEATDFEDAIRNAISIGGDSDTIGCITGAIAEPLFGIPQAIYDKGLSLLPSELREVVEEFEAKYGKRVIA